MRITHHGGGCCAIKQISMLGCDPDEFMYPIDAPKDLDAAKWYAKSDARGTAVDSSRNIYWFSRPSETAGERFDAYLDFLRKHRPCSLVEVTIVPYEDSARYPDDEDYWEQYQEDWIPFLKQRGFKCVAKVEELVHELKKDYTIAIVTHNMQQAARVSDFTAYMYLGEMVEFGKTDELFIKPQKKETEDYITGRFG